MATALTIGKPKGLKKIVSERIRGVIAEVVAKRAEEMMNAQMDAAIGITVERTDINGQLTYVDKGPDVAAARLLLEYSIGKPVEEKNIKVAVGIVNLVSQLEDQDGTTTEDN